MSITPFYAATCAALMFLRSAPSSTPHHHTDCQGAVTLAACDTASYDRSSMIPSNAEYRAVVSEGNLVVRIKAHSIEQVHAAFEIRDSASRVIGQWNALLTNQDHDEIEWNEGPDGLSYAVMVYRSAKPYPVELRVPDDDGQQTGWLYLSVVHPQIKRTGSEKMSLMLVRVD